MWYKARLYMMEEVDHVVRSLYLHFKHNRNYSKLFLKATFKAKKAASQELLQHEE